MESLLMDLEAGAYELKTEYSHARQVQEAILHQTSAVLSPAGHGYALVNIASLDIVTGTSADIVSRNLDTGMTAFQNAHHPRSISFCDFAHADLRLHRQINKSCSPGFSQLFQLSAFSRLFR